MWQTIAISYFIAFQILVLGSTRCENRQDLIYYDPSSSSHDSKSGLPITYIFQLENEEDTASSSAYPSSTYTAYKTKRSVIESIGSDNKRMTSSLISGFIGRFDDANALVKRVKRTLENLDQQSASSNRDNKKGNNVNFILPSAAGPKDLHLKANLRYHHQQRHPNGSISGSYAQIEPTGQMKVTHYVNDELGFREYPEDTSTTAIKSSSTSPANDPLIKSPSAQINVVTNSANGMFPPSTRNSDTGQPLPGSTSTSMAESANMNFVPSVAPPFNGPPAMDALQNSPILNSAHGTVNQYTPKSPLFEKYYRPSPQEVQHNYDYHRMRTGLDPEHFRPTDMTPIPEIPRDKQPELKSVYTEYQMPYQARSADEAPPGFVPFNAAAAGGSPPTSYNPPILPLNIAAGSSAQPASADPFARIPSGSAYPVVINGVAGDYQPHPMGMAIQSAGPDNPPAYMAGSMYSGPHNPNVATYNHPYPSNVPIYAGPVPQNVATFAHPPPDNIPVYQQQPQMMPPNYNPNLQVYYAAGSNPQPIATTKI